MKCAIWYQPKNKRLPTIDIDEKKLLNMARFCSVCAGALLVGMPVLPAEATATAATTTATTTTAEVSGIGASLALMLKMAAYGSIASILASALNQGQIANLLKVATIFSCIGIIIGVIVDAIVKVNKFLGVG